MLPKLKMVLATGVALACLSGAAPAADVKFGFLGGVTGPIESLVPPIIDGTNLAATHVNEQGGLMDGKTIEFVVADTTCADATKASDAADRLVNVENVSAIVGPLCSGATISAANNAGVPGGVAMISPSERRNMVSCGRLSPVRPVTSTRSPTTLMVPMEFMPVSRCHAVSLDCIS